LRSTKHEMSTLRHLAILACRIIVDLLKSIDFLIDLFHRDLSLFKWQCNIHLTE